MPLTSAPLLWCCLVYLVKERIIGHRVSVSPDSGRVSISPLTPYNELMITRMLVLAMVLTIALVGTTPALAQPDIETAKPILGYPFEITDKGQLVEGAM
jgi:hypothetical protein